MTDEVKKQYKELESYLKSIASKKWDESYKEAEESKTVCPFCGSTNITQDIKRVQGKIDGEMSGSWGLFGGGMSGSVHGDIDTNEVKVCQDCKNVWKPQESEYESADDIFYDLLWHFYHYIEYRDEIVEFDENNPEEEYKSQEEKQKAHDKEFKENYYDESNELRNFYPEVIRWYIQNNHSYEHDYLEEIASWSDKCFADYGFKMPPNWEEEEKGNNLGMVLLVIFVIAIIVGLIYFRVKLT
jgi:hypothetical protein